MRFCAGLFVTLLSGRRSLTARRCWHAVAAHSIRPSRHQQKILKAAMKSKAGCVGVLGLLLLVFGVLVLALFDTIVNKFIQKELVLRNGTDVYQTWKHPPVVPHLKVYFFNLTNSEEFLKGEKPILQEVGPYCYREHWEKINVSFHDNDTVSYETQKFYYFEEHHSVGPESDVIVTLNIPMVSAVSQWRFAARLAKLALSSMLEVLKEKPIVAHTVGEFMWGYDDPLLNVAKDILPPDQRLPYDKFGFFVERNGSTGGLFNVFTGATDMSLYTTIDRFEHEKDLTYWKTDECNKIKGTDGSSYPPGITTDTVLYLFNKNLCRSVPLTFWHHIEKFGVPGMRFTPPSDVFASPKVKPENDCYCVGGPPCAGDGVFNISTCMFGSPSIVSWPHFYQADPKFLNAVEGLSPDADKHALFIDVSPRTGAPLSAQARLQINIAVPHVPIIKPAEMLREIIFPILWFEDGVTELPDHVVELLRLAENTPAVLKSTVLSLCFVIGAVLVTGVAVAFLAVKFDWPIPFFNPDHNKKPVEGKSYYANHADTNKRQEVSSGYSNPVVSDEPENDTT